MALTCLALLTACAGQVTIQPPITKAPTSTAATTATATTGQCALRRSTPGFAPPPEARVVLCDTLLATTSARNQGGWDSYVPGTDADGACQIGAQGYLVQVPVSSKNGGLNCDAESSNFADFAYAIDMRIVPGATTDATFGAGITFRCTTTPDLCYEFTFDQSSEFSLFAFSDGNQVKSASLPIIDQGSLFFNAGANSTNELAVLAQGDTITLFVNGHQITKVLDTTNGKGTVGITVDAPAQGTADVVFTNAVVWKLP